MPPGRAFPPLPAQGRRALVCIPFLLLLCAVACGPQPALRAPSPPADPPIHLKIAAVPAAAGALEECLDVYQEGYPGLSWEWALQSGERALRALEEGWADLALVDLPLAPGPTATLALRAPLLVVVHPSNRLHDLSAPAIAALLGGKAEDWSQVGGDPGPVHLYLPPDHTGEARAFVAEALAGHPLAGDGLLCMTPESLASRVAEDPQGVGLLPGTAVPAGVRALAVDGCAPGQDCYPWWLDYWLVWRADLPERSLRVVRSALASCPQAAGR